jgi:hypothetical protein
MAVLEASCPGMTANPIVPTIDSVACYGTVQAKSIAPPSYFVSFRGVEDGPRKSVTLPVGLTHQFQKSECRGTFGRI